VVANRMSEPNFNSRYGGSFAGQALARLPNGAFEFSERAILRSRREVGLSGFPVPG
jgi:hypothetical protein